MLEQQSVTLLEGNLDSHLELCTYHFKVELIRILVQSFLLKCSEGILFLVIVTRGKKNKNKPNPYRSCSAVSPCSHSLMRCRVLQSDAQSFEEQTRLHMQRWTLTSGFSFTLYSLTKLERNSVRQ